MKFEDNRGKDRFWLDLNSMDFYDAGGHDRLFVGMGTGDIPFMRVYDHSGTERLVIGGAAGESPVLKIFDTSHTERGFFGNCKCRGAECPIRACNARDLQKVPT